ncbi:unnamed protein product, partial [marine sediment metagenome]
MSNWSDTYLIAGFNLEITSTAGDATPYLPPHMKDFTASGPADLTINFKHEEEAQADPLKRFFPSKFRLSLHEERLVFVGVDGRVRILGWISSQRDWGEMGLPPLQGPWRIEQ